MAGPCYQNQIKDFPFTPEETAAIRKFSRDNYIDKGVRDISATISGVASDLGLRPEWVAKALTSGVMKPVSNELYARMSDRRVAVSAAKDYISSIDAPAWKQVAQAIYRVPFSVAVAYHGTVGGVTHAGAIMFRPSAWREYWPNFIKQAQLVASPAIHEAAIRNLMRDPNYITAKRGGLANDPARIYTDYEAYSKLFGLRAGQRGFDMLKLLRQEMFNKQWDSVSSEIKSDPKAAIEMSRGLSEMINHSTGALSSSEKGFIANAAKVGDPIAFAARLEASRWARVIGDPIKTADTFLNWKNASAVDRHVATVRLRHAAEFGTVYVASLVANQAFLSAVGSKDKINLTDPSKSDWLKHKVAGRTVATDGNLLAPIRLLGRIVFNDLTAPRKQLRGDTRTAATIKDVGQYALGKAAPTVGIVKELATGESFEGRLMPWSTDTSKKPKLTWTEFGLSHAMIPLSGATREAYDAMRSRGISHPDAQSLLRGLAVLGAELTGAKVGHEPKEPEQGEVVKRQQLQRQ